MAAVKMYDSSGADKGQVDVPDALLVLDRGEQAVHETVLHQLARRRKGTASTLRKGEVAGSNKKPWKQKGTGRARAGLRQSPVWRGGGVAFGPHPREFGGRVNRKVAHLAFRRALSDRLAEGAVKVVDAVRMPEAKTKHVVALMKALNVAAPALFIMDKPAHDVVLAARNIPGVEVVTAGDVNVYQLVRYPVIVVVSAAMDVLTQRLGSKTASGAAK